MSQSKSKKEELLLELSKKILSSGDGGGEGLGAVKSVSTALQIALIALSYNLVEKMSDILEASDKVLERIRDEQVLNRMSPRTLLEAYKALNDVLNKYSSYTSTLHKNIDIERLESDILELLAKGTDMGQESQAVVRREELASEILSLMGKKLN